MQYILAIVAFSLIFVLVFVLGGWFLMPHLPPTPDHPVSAFELEYWSTNWIGALFGLVFGGLSAQATLRKMKAVDERDEER